MGLALWSEENKLIRAWLARSTTTPKDNIGERWRSVIKAVGTGNVETLIIEYPQIYRMSRGDNNDLLNLATVIGGIIQSFTEANVIRLLPHQWKGNEKKETLTLKIQTKLSLEELTRVEIPRAKSLAHNMWDAIGIGLYYFDRLRSKK